MINNHEKFKKLAFFGTILLFVGPVIIALLNKAVIGVDENGNHWGDVITMLTLLYIWPLVFVVYLAAGIASLITRRVQKSTATSYLNIICFAAPLTGLFSGLLLSLWGTF